jgi:DNA primase
MKEVRRVPYRLPELLKADPSCPVFIPEGEKDCNRLWDIGLVSTTNVGGAGKWRADDGEFLRGRQVVLLPDNDDVGRRHAELVAHALHEIAAGVRILPLPEVGEKGDVSDWLDAGHGADEL